MHKMKTRILIGFIALLMLLSVVSNAQQDPMYTQYMFNTQTVNPAYAGTWESVGFMVLGRQQWAGWEGAPETYTFTFQAPLKNSSLSFSETGSEKRGFHFPSFSVAYSDRKRQHIPVLQETLN